MSKFYKFLNNPFLGQKIENQFMSRINHILSIYKGKFRCLSLRGTFCATKQSPRYLKRLLW